MNYEEKTIWEENKYRGNIIDVDLVTVELPNGKITTRDVVRHPGASVVIPITDEGIVYLVKQYRKPINKICLELPAGKLDKGEDPKECALRELKEETGLDTLNIRHVTSVHSAPGFTDEVLHMYLATELIEGKACADEDEFISTEKMHINEVIDMIFKNEITDAKTIIGILAADKILRG